MRSRFPSLLLLFALVGGCANPTAAQESQPSADAASVGRSETEVTATVPSSTSVRPANGSRIDGALGAALVAEGARLVDVRTPEEFAAGHIAGATNLPVQELQQRLGELAPKDVALVLYCRSGNRSGQAATLLVEQGFAAVFDLGPMTAWPN